MNKWIARGKFKLKLLLTCSQGVQGYDAPPRGCRGTMHHPNLPKGLLLVAKWTKNMVFVGKLGRGEVQKATFLVQKVHFSLSKLSNVTCLSKTSMNSQILICELSFRQTKDFKKKSNKFCSIFQQFMDLP